MQFALICQVVSEKMLENNGHIRLYSPGAGTDNPLGSFFININCLLIWSFPASFFPLYDV